MCAGTREASRSYQNLQRAARNTDRNLRARTHQIQPHLAGDGDHGRHPPRRPRLSSSAPPPIPLRPSRARLFFPPWPLLPPRLSARPEGVQAPAAAAPSFQPLTASSSSLSLDFLPDIFDFCLSDSHLGLLLLRHKADDLDNQKRSFVVCDPVTRRHALVPSPPIDRFSGGEVIGVVLLSRAADTAAGLQFEVVCVAVDVDRPRAWVGSFRDGWCRWNALPRSREVTIDFDLMRFERICVHAAGGMYWHILNSHFVLALDAATMEFSCLPPPAMMWGDIDGHHKYRIGEMPEDGRLCVASLEENHGLQLCVRGDGEDSDNGWVLERRIPIKELLDAVPSLPKDLLVRHYRLWLGDMDAGRTGRVFINTMGYGKFSYHLDTGKLDCLTRDDDMTYGHPMFAYFSASDGCSN